MIDLVFVYKHLPKVFGALAFIVNPIFVYLIFTETTTKFGNYRYLLLTFAIFNLVYTVTNLMVPIDIHSYRYCFYLFTNSGFFVESSDWHLHLLSFRCALVSASYAVILSHFIYRYLVIHDSTLTRGNIHIYLMMMFGALLIYTSVWHALCYYLGSANTEIKEYIRKDFGEFYGIDSINTNMVACLYNEGTESTIIRSWSATSSWTIISLISIGVFMKLAYMIMTTLRKMATNMSRKTSKLQIELFRALIVQAVIPIFVCFFPCFISFLVPIFNLDLGRAINYFEVIAVGAFAFCDPVAIIMCLPVFRERLMCKKAVEKQKAYELSSVGNTTKTA